MLFLSLVVIQLAIFAILIFFLKHILTRNIRSATDHLNELNQDYTQKMEEANKRFQDGEKYYDNAIIRAKTDAEKTKIEILKEARIHNEQVVTDARKQSEDILAQGLRAKEIMIEEMEQRIEARACEKASEYLVQILPLEISQDMHNKWTDQALMKGFSDLSRMNFPEGELRAKVVSAYSLAYGQKKILEDKINDALKRKVVLEEIVDRSLVAGIQVTVGNIVIDSTLKYKIRELTRRAKQPS